MLQNIKIKGFKSIKELDLDLKPINILIGANGAGKSNFISFFKLVNNIYEQSLENYSLRSGPDNLLHFGRKKTKLIYGELNFGYNIYKFELEPTLNYNTLYIKNEFSIYDNPHSPKKYKDYHVFNLKESSIKYSTSERNKILRNYLVSYKIYHFHDTSFVAPLRSVAHIDDCRYLKEDGSNLPAFLYFLKIIHPYIFERIEKTIKSVIPFFDKFILEPSTFNKELIKIEWLERGHPETLFNAYNLSDGSLRFIALATLLLQPNLPKIIIIDEPELGLHPVAITELSGLLNSVASEKCQIIISTQSISLIDNFECEDIITVDRKDDQSVFNRLENEKLKYWLENYSIGELWDKSVIKGQPI